jgi:hypothetical protein
LIPVVINFKTLPNGEEKEFLTCEGILWKKFAKCIEIFDRDGFKGHSMELNPNTITGHFSKDGHYYFDNASFDGLCILGDEVQPAMIGSIVEKFAVEPLKLDFTQLLTEINNSIKHFSLQNQTLENKVDDIELNMQKGGTQIVDEKIIEVLKQFNLTPENIGFSIEGMSVEDLKTKLNEQFTMSANQLDSAIRKELNNRKIIMNDSWDGTPYEVNEFYLRDIKGSIAIVINYDWDTYFGIPFTITGDVVVLDFDAKIEYVSDWREKTTSDIANNFSKEALNDRTMGIINQFNAMKDKINSLNSDFETSNNNYSELKSQYDEIKNNFDTLNTEVEPLRKYQKDKIEAERKLAENELFNQYDEKLNTIEAYQKLKETASQYTIQNLEKEIALTIDCDLLVENLVVNFT